MWSALRFTCPLLHPGDIHISFTQPYLTWGWLLGLMSYTVEDSDSVFFSSIISFLCHHPINLVFPIWRFCFSLVFLIFSLLRYIQCGHSWSISTNVSNPTKLNFYKFVTLQISDTVNSCMKLHISGALFFNFNHLDYDFLCKINVVCFLNLIFLFFVCDACTLKIIILLIINTEVIFYLELWEYNWAFHA